MSEDQRDGTDEVVEAVEGFTVAVPTQMQLLSTWEVRKVPHNCVTRLCTLTVTRLQVRQCLEPSLPSLVLAVSMKTPHRFLRSNEIPLPTSGLLDIPLQLTFSLQYPHFIKRGGNVLQIRVQRRKRYRNRPLGGYKTLAMGTVEMSHVLQACYQGEVGLYSGKPPQPLATVTVGSLTSTPVYMEPQREGSSDEEEDEIGFSDYHGSDSDSGEGGEVYREAGRPHKHKRKGAKPSSMMLRLLGIKSSKNRAVVDELLNLQGEDPESAVAFASSGTESEEEEDPLGHQSTPPRPTLSPYFGSDHCSVVSIPNSVRSAETLHSSDHYLQQPSSLPASLPVLRRYKSMERAIHSGMDRSISFTAGSSPLTFDLDIQKGRLWVVDAALEAVVSSLKEVGESVMALQTTEGAVATLQPLLTGIEAAWKQQDKFYLIAVVGEEWLVAVILQAMLQSRASDMHFRTALIPTSVGVVSGRMGVLDEELHALFPLDTDWTQMNSGPLLQFVEGAVHSQPLPVAQLLLHRPSQDSAAAAQDPTPIPFIFSVSIGSAEMDVEQLPSPPSSISISEATDLVVEYWVGKKEKSSLKVRSVTVTCGGQGLNVTMLKDKKGKGIRIRKKEKEGESGGSIVSLSAAQLLCRPSNKQETLSVVVDGVDWKEVGSVKMSANTGYSISLVTSTPHP